MAVHSLICSDWKGLSQSNLDQTLWGGAPLTTHAKTQRQPSQNIANSHFASNTCNHGSTTHLRRLRHHSSASAALAPGAPLMRELGARRHQRLRACQLQGMLLCPPHFALPALLVPAFDRLPAPPLYYATSPISLTRGIHVPAAVVHASSAGSYSYLFVTLSSTLFSVASRP